MERKSEMSSGEDQLELGLELDSAVEFSSGSLFNPTTSEPGSDEKMDQEPAAEQGPDSGISESLNLPPPMTPLEPGATAIADPPAAPTAPLTVATASQTSPTQEEPQDWPLLVANDDNEAYELAIVTDVGLEKRQLTEHIAKAKAAGKVLIINGKIERAQGGLDRVKYLGQRIMSELAKNATELHTQAFRESQAMKTIVSLAQTLYHPQSKYCAVSTFLADSNLKTAELRQVKYRSGLEPIVIEDDTPPPSKSPRLTRTVVNESAQAPSTSASVVRAPTTLPTTSGAPWPATATNNSGWNATSSSSANWSATVTNNSGWTASSSSSNNWPATSGLVAPRPVHYVQDLCSDPDIIDRVERTELRRQVAALERVVYAQGNQHRNRSGAGNGRERDDYRRRGGYRGGYRGRGAQRGGFGITDSGRGRR